MMIDLYNGDCLEVMKSIPDGSVDMVLTDPPYGMSFVSGRRKIAYNPIDNDNSLEWIDELASECYRIAKDNTGHYVFCSYHHIDKFKQAFEKHFKIKNILTWVKNNHSMGDLKGDFASKTEFILFLQKGRCLIRGKRDCNVLQYARTGNELHPTQKPVDMLEFLISKFSDESMVICDPFMGSGSTMIACLNTNRKGIGIELDKHYFDIAQKRINEHKTASSATGKAEKATTEETK